MKDLKVPVHDPDDPSEFLFTHWLRLAKSEPLGMLDLVDALRRVGIPNCITTSHLGITDRVEVGSTTLTIWLNGSELLPTNIDMEDVNLKIISTGHLTLPPILRVNDLELSFNSETLDLPSQLSCANLTIGSGGKCDIIIGPMLHTFKQVILDCNIPEGLNCDELVLLPSEEERIIPSDLYCECLWASGANISKIPVFTESMPDLHLDRTKVTEIPSGQEYNTVHLCHTKVKEIPKGLRFLKLYLNCTEVSEIPAGVDCEVLSLTHTKVKEIPKDIGCGLLDLSNTEVKEIPTPLDVTYLSVDNTKVTEIPMGYTGKSLSIKGVPDLRVPVNCKITNLYVDTFRLQLVRLNSDY